MNLNWKQRVVLWVAGVVVFLMLMYPPYLSPTPVKYSGYRFLLEHGYPIHCSVLLTQWVGVLILTALGMLVLKGKGK